jgi:hypothetical protein
MTSLKFCLGTANRENKQYSQGLGYDIGALSIELHFVAHINSTLQGLS